jgi:hypothetical protein
MITDPILLLLAVICMAGAAIFVVFALLILQALNG